MHKNNDVFGPFRALLQHLDRIVFTANLRNWLCYSYLLCGIVAHAQCGFELFCYNNE